MTIFLTHPVTAAQPVRIPATAASTVSAPLGYATLEPRRQSTLADSTRPDAAAPLGTNGRWI